MRINNGRMLLRRIERETIHFIKKKNNTQQKEQHKS